MLPGLPAFHPEERISVWMGHRPSLPDSLPVIGPSRATPDVIYAFGHGHVGMTSAPMTGKVIADLVAAGSHRTPRWREKDSNRGTLCEWG